MDRVDRNLMLTAVPRIFSIATALLLAACGGGGGAAVPGSGTSSGGSGSAGGGSTGGTPPPPTATGNLVSLGTVTGFGGVRSNGIEFNVSSATITLDGEAVTIGQLQAGQLVQIDSTLPTAGLATARSVAAMNWVIGPVRSIDRAAGLLRVLDQQVMTDSATSYGGFASNVVSLAEVNEGDVLAISGVRFKNGFEMGQTYVQATRINRITSTGPWLVRGQVARLDAAARAFNLSEMRIAYSGASPQPAALANDECVVVRGTAVAEPTVSQPRTLTATSVVRVPCNPPVLPGDRMVAEGRAVEGIEPAGFTLGTLAVRYNSSTIPTNVLDGTDGQITNRMLRVEGAVDASGKLVATAVETRGNLDNQFRVRGPATVNGNSLSVLGVTIEPAAGTRYEDRSPQALRTFGRDSIRSGDVVEVRGIQVVDSNRVSAAVIERHATTESYALQGLPTDLAPPNFRILGVAIATDGSTQWLNANPLILNAAGALFDIGPQPPGLGLRFRATCVQPCVPFRAAEMVESNGANGW
jgi:hypothetical protein